MSKLIKNGTIVTADVTYKADVFIQHGKIVAIGENLKHAADHVLDASGCYVMPGGIDPHTHLEMPFMGTQSGRGFLHRHARRALRRHHDGRRFRAARRRPVAGRGAAGLAPEGRQGGRRLFLPHGGHLVGREGVEGDAGGREARRQHLQAFHGLQGRADGERRRDVPVVPALRRDRRASRSSMPRTATWSRACSRNTWRPARPGRRATPIRARRRWRARRPTAPS